MGRNSSPPNLLAAQLAGGAPAEMNQTSDTVTQQRAPENCQAPFQMLKDDSASECSLKRCYSSASSSSTSAELSTALSTDQRSCTSSQVTWKEIHSSSSLSSLGSSASVSRTDFSSSSRPDKTVLQSFEAHALCGASAVTSSLENARSMLLPSNCDGVSFAARNTAVEEQQQRQRQKQELQPRSLQGIESCPSADFKVGSTLDTGEDSCTRNTVAEKVDDQRPRNDSNWRASRIDTEKEGVAGAMISKSWRSPAKVEGATERCGSSWRATRIGTSGKQCIDNKDSSSLFSAQLEKAIANLASSRGGAIDGDRMKIHDNESHGQKYFAAERHKLVSASALLSAPERAENSGSPPYSRKMRNDRVRETNAGVAFLSPAPDTPRNTCGGSFLLPPDAGTQAYFKRPTSAPPTLTKLSASTLFGFPLYDSLDHSSTSLTRDEVYYQLCRKLCETLPARPSSGENSPHNQKSRETLEDDAGLNAAAAAAAAAFLQEHQGNRLESKQVQERQQQRGQQIPLPSEQHSRNGQRQLAAAALKLARDQQQQQRATGAASKGNNEDCISLAVAAVAAALLRESQPSWREDEKNQTPRLLTETRPGSRAALQVLSHSGAGENTPSTMSASPAAGLEILKDLDYRRLTSSHFVDVPRSNRSLQPTSLAAAAAAAIKGGRRDYTLSLSVPHSPVGLSSLLSSPCSSKAPPVLPRRSGGCSPRPSGNNFFETAAAEATVSFQNSPRDRSLKPRMLHEHHRLLLALPQESDAGSAVFKGHQRLGTAPRITVVKTDGDTQQKNDGERRFSALDVAARVLVSAAAGSKAQLLLQQLESEEREVFRCASAPPGESASSLLCSADFPSDFASFPPHAQAGERGVKSPKRTQPSSHDENVAEPNSSRANSSIPCYGNPLQEQRNTIVTPAVEHEQINDTSAAEEDTVGVTVGGEPLKENPATPIAASCMPAPSTQQYVPTITCTHGAHASKQQHPQQNLPRGASQTEINDAMQGKGSFTANRFPMNNWMDAAAFMCAGGGTYPSLYNSPSMMPGRQICSAGTSFPGCWEADHATLLATRMAADAAEAMTVGYSSSPTPAGVFLGPPPMLLPLGTSAAAEVQQHLMRAAAGALFLQHQSAAAAAAAAAANRGDSNEWGRPAVAPHFGRAGDRTPAQLLTSPAAAAAAQFDYLKPMRCDSGGGAFYGGGGGCCGVGGVGLSSGYSNVGRYFPEDPLGAAATLAAVDPYNWTRANTFPPARVGIHDGQGFGAGSADFSVANAGSSLEDPSKLQHQVFGHHMQHQLQPVPVWAPENNGSHESTTCAQRHGGEVSRSNSSPNLTSTKREEQLEQKSSPKEDVTGKQLFYSEHCSTEEGSRGRKGESAAGRYATTADTSGGREKRSDILAVLGEEGDAFRQQKGAGLTITKERFKGHVAAIARDQLGCRVLQRLIREGDDHGKVQIVYEEILEDGGDLMLDPFGNYLVQKVLEVVPEDKFLAYLTRASPRLVKACFSTHGTRSVQKIVEIIAKQVDQSRPLKVLVNALEPALAALVRDSNANHVIQKALSMLSFSSCEFIFTHVETYCVAICKERHGCCVVQRSIDAASEETQKRLLAIISKNAVELVQDSFGNYVVQYVLELHIPTATDAIMASLKGRICALSKQKFSSNVVEKCLANGTPAQVRAVVEELLGGGEEQFRDLLLDQFGNYVIQRALTVSRPTGQELLLRAISPCLPYLRRTSAGGCVAHRLVKRFPSLGLSPNPTHCTCTVPGRTATSPTLVGDFVAKERTPKRARTTPRGQPKKSLREVEQQTRPAGQGGTSQRTHSNENRPAAWNASQSGLAEGDAEKKTSFCQVILKTHKNKTRKGRTVVQSSSRRHAPAFSTIAWAPICRTTGTPAGSQGGEKDRRISPTTDCDKDKREAGRTTFCAGKSSLEAHSGRNSSNDGANSSAMALNSNRLPETQTCSGTSDTSGSGGPALDTAEDGCQKVQSWPSIEAKDGVVIHGQQLAGSSGAASTAFPTIPRSGRKGAARKTTQHRASKPLRVSLT